MKLRQWPGAIRDVLLRMLPHRAPTGLVAIGQPDRDAPVLLTGNYTLTVRRLRDALVGHDAWLLCANSNGINVWCAAGGGHLTHHDVISVIRTTRVADKVDHREVILPQLCATGVERRKVEEVTGWTSRWGPARLEDLPAFLDRGKRVRKSERLAPFPAWERAELATTWSVPMLVVSAPIVGWVWGIGTMSAAALALATAVFGLFMFLPWLKVTGRWRYVTYAAFALIGFAMGGGALALFGAAAPANLAAVAAVALLGCLILSLDLAGTTPWYPSTINTFDNVAEVELLEEQCTGAADCVQVCPRGVLKMNGSRRKVEITQSERCIQCGACIVQCPDDALRFRFADGRVVEAAAIRRTRMNMVGRRTVAVPE